VPDPTIEPRSRAVSGRSSERNSLSGANGVARPGARSRFLWLRDTKFWVRGATYGTFRPDEHGHEYRADVVERDFAQMAAAGFNAIRTYSVPPRWLLDTALRHGLRVMVGVPWEQHVAFLDDRGRARSIENRVRDSVAACARHPAILAYAVGNEIPAPVVRWHGGRAVTRFLGRLAECAKREDPTALVTYVNYPSTEYLDLPFLDLVCFNVYLESPERLEAYLARLHTIAGDRPLLLTEIGLDSRRNGEPGQAKALEWQVREAFASGCAGAFVFSWTDEWHRGGADVGDWDFGLTDRARRPKPALAAVRASMSDVPFDKALPCPRISVVVCSYNGARTIRECLEGLLRVEYPNFEVIVVDDGSTDATARIAAAFPFRLIRTPNRGLSSARNTGLAAATGEIVAYIDDDAWPDPDWLTFLAHTFRSTDFAGAGGPNIPPPGDGWIAECVAHAPGGPIHVLVSDHEAEHVPGCNMAFRKRELDAIGGFDPQFRAAGDDVDVCWRLQERGWRLGFSPAAVVWHHRRNSVQTYWRQQMGYGRAEALLERKWPEKYNAAGHISWRGRIYGDPLVRALGGGRQRVYHGRWGSALFQSLYAPAPSVLTALPLMPEWYIVITILAALAAIGALWTPLAAIALPLLGGAVVAPVVLAVLAAVHAPIREGARGARGAVRSRAVVAWLHLLQPAARLVGRATAGLTPWRRRGLRAVAAPRPRSLTLWTETWHAPAAVLGTLTTAIRKAGFVVAPGGDWDRWDLEVRGGLLGSARLLMATEEHGHGRQLWRFRIWPRWSSFGVTLIAGLGVLTVGAAADRAWSAALILGVAALLLAVRGLADAGTAIAAFVIGRHVVAETLAPPVHERVTAIPRRRVRIGAADTSRPRPETKTA
jgi:O-antigen biosynthesis protein